VDRRDCEIHARPRHLVNIEHDEAAVGDVLSHHVQGHAAVADAILQEGVLGCEVRQAPSRTLIEALKGAFGNTPYWER
jgi:hypothetical protein